jgi:hypothetical protein
MTTRRTSRPIHTDDLPAFSLQSGSGHQTESSCPNEWQRGGIVKPAAKEIFSAESCSDIALAVRFIENEVNPAPFAEFVLKLCWQHLQFVPGQRKLVPGPRLLV